MGLWDEQPDSPNATFSLNPRHSNVALLRELDA
jgi:hypothetical protein